MGVKRKTIFLYSTQRLPHLWLVPSHRICFSGLFLPFPTSVGPCCGWLTKTYTTCLLLLLEIGDETNRPSASTECSPERVSTFHLNKHVQHRGYTHHPSTHHRRNVPAITTSQKSQHGHLGNFIIVIQVWNFVIVICLLLQLFWFKYLALEMYFLSRKIPM